MYLIHDTNDIKSIESILNDGYLKSSYMLSKEGKSFEINIGEGCYETNKYVYFSCSNKICNKPILGSIRLYFKSKLLYNKKFYVSTYWTSKPYILKEFVASDGKINYCYSYEKHYKNYKKVIQKLYKNNKLYNHQIAVFGKINLKYLVAIKFSSINQPTKNILEYIYSYYPNITIL